MWLACVLLVGLALLHALRPAAGRRHGLAARLAAWHSFLRSRGGTPLGRDTAFPWLPVRLPSEARMRHVHVVGPTGAGKTSRVLAPLLTADLRSGAGVTVLETKDGELCAVALKTCRHMGRPALVWDPLLDGSPGWNPIAGDALVAAERLVYALARLGGGTGGTQSSAGAAYYEAIGQSLLRHAVLTVKGAWGEAATLLDVRRLLQDRRFLADSLERAPDAFFLQTWAAWKPDERARNQAGVENRLDALLAHPRLAAALTRPGIDLEQVLAAGGVLLARLPAGEFLQLGEAIGTFLLAAFQAAVYGRPPAPRPPHFLYVDEFQRFVAPGFADFLATARGFGAGAVLAHQNLAQLGPLRETILANARSRIVLACDAPDARALAPGLLPAEDLMELPFGVAAVRVAGHPRTRQVRLRRVG